MELKIYEHNLNLKKSTSSYLLTVMHSEAGQPVCLCERLLCCARVSVLCWHLIRTWNRLTRPAWGYVLLTLHVTLLMVCSSSSHAFNQTIHFIFTCTIPIQPCHPIAFLWLDQKTTTVLFNCNILILASHHFVLSRWSHFGLNFRFTICNCLVGLSALPCALDTYAIGDANYYHSIVLFNSTARGIRSLLGVRVKLDCSWSYTNNMAAPNWERIECCKIPTVNKYNTVSKLWTVSNTLSRTCIISDACWACYNLGNTALYAFSCCAWTDHHRVIYRFSIPKYSPNIAYCFI